MGDADAKTNGEGPWKAHAKQNGEGPWNASPILPIPPHVPHALPDDKRRELALVELRYAAGVAGLLKESYEALARIIEPS